MESAEVLQQWLRGLDAEGFNELIAFRPELRECTGDEDVAELAQLLVEPYGALGAFIALPQPARDLVEAAMGLGATTSVDRLAEFLDPGGNDAETHRQLVRGWLESIVAAAICWGPPERVHVNPGLYDAIQGPVWLGVPAVRLLERVTVHELRTMVRAWGDPTVVIPNRRNALITTICDYLAEPDHIRRIIAGAPADVLAWVTEQADRAAHRIRTTPSIRFFDDSMEVSPEFAEFDRNRYLAAARALEWLGEHGLAVSPYGYRTPADVPAEVIRAMLPPTVRAPFRWQEPVVVTTVVDPGQSESAAAAAVSEFLAALMATLESMSRTPLAQLKAGGIGARELARLAKAAAVAPEEARMAVELGYRMGLFELDENEAVTTGEQFEQWRRLEPAERAADALHAWYHTEVATSVGTEDGKAVPALTRRGRGAMPNPMLLLDTLASFEEGIGAVSAAEVFAVAAWDSGDLERPPGDAEVTWAEAHRLGAVAHGRLTNAGRALSEHRSEDLPELTAALTGMLPKVEANILFGSDLTVVVPGSPAAGVVDLLDAIAVREARGAASTWRISAGSVREALDGGQAVDAILEDLAALSDKPLPQAVDYLIRDVGRRYGHVQVHPAGAVVVSDDEALVAEVAATRSLASLGLRQVAPTVLVATAPQSRVLAALRAAGFLPRALDEHGQSTVRLARSGASGTSAAGR